MAKSRARKFAELLDGSDNIKSARLSNVSSVGGDTGVDFNDSVKAQWGNSDDLQIYHNGSHSYISDTGTGRLYITTNGEEIRLTPQSGGENGLRVQQDGAVNLYYDNAQKLFTKSTGVEVTGNLEVGGSRGVTAVSGDYGSVQSVGGKGGWSGYAFSTKPYVLMSNNTHWGLYDDNVNAWTLYYNRTSRHLATMSEGSDNLRVNLTQGSSKYWSHVDNKSQFTVRDSYNQTSVTDGGVGRIDTTINNNMNNTNYVANGTAGSLTGGSSDAFVMIYNYGVGGFRFANVRASFIDADHNVMAVHGDLA